MKRAAEGLQLSNTDPDTVASFERRFEAAQTLVNLGADLRRRAHLRHPAEPVDYAFDRMWGKPRPLARV